MLDDYARPDVDVSFQEPFASRLLKLLEFFAGRLVILSGRRSYGEQRVLWERYLAGGNLAARPGTSNHERGVAADLERTDPALSWAEVHAAGNRVGIWFPIIGENWHAEAMRDWDEPELPEDGMNKEEFAAAIGAQIDPATGLVSVELLEDDLVTLKLYPLASALSYIHREGKLSRRS